MPTFKRPFPPKVVRKRTGFIQFEHTPEGIALQKSMNRGFNLATVIAGGNYETRNFRQKPIVVLETATHTPNPNRKFSQKAVVVAKNTLLPTNTTMPVVYKKAFPPKKVSKKATNRKNVSNLKKASQPKSVTKTLVKDVKALKQAVNAINSHHTYKISACGTIKSLIGRCNHVAYPGSTVSLLEAAVANLRFYDPAAPGTLVTANPNTGTYARDINVQNFYMKTLLRNNYQVPCRVKVYLCKTKIDQANDIVTTYTNSISDTVINAGVDETDALIYITDIERMKEMWAIDCVVDKVLEPGQEVTASHSTGKFQFDPSHIDLITDAYQKSLNSFEFLIRVEGVLGHDTAVATEQSLLLAGVDVQNVIKVNVEYNSGGADLNDIYITENRIQAFTNGGVCSLKPVADNIAYSIS